MEIKIMGEPDQQVFNQHVAKFSGDLLQTYQWGEIKAYTEWEPIRLAVIHQGQIQATICILKRVLPIVKAPIFYAPRGPVLDFSHTKVLDFLLKHINQMAKEQGAVFLKIDPPINAHEQDVAKILAARNFRHLDKGANFEGIQPRFVMKLDITPSETNLLANMKSKTRYNIRYGQKKGVKIKENCTKEDLAVFYQILLETAQRDNFTVRSYKYFQLLWDHLVKAQLGKLFMASYEGEYIAGTFVFRLGPTAWYVYGASSNEQRQVMPNYALQWAMIKWAQRNGCKVYDFRGVSGENDPKNPLYGLFKFKAGFGADIVEYLGEYDLVYRPLLYSIWQFSEPWQKQILKLKAKLRPTRKG